MTIKRSLGILVLPTVLGTLAAFSFVPKVAYAVVGCELNACRSAVGDCDLTDMHISCKETTGGCETIPCSAN
jgi:hypothetical protein